jgi:hypothetical protein
MSLSNSWLDFDFTVDINFQTSFLRKYARMPRLFTFPPLVGGDEGEGEKIVLN